MKNYTFTITALLLSIALFAQSTLPTPYFQEDECLRIIQTQDGLEVIDVSLPPMTLFANDVLVFNNQITVNSASLPLTLTIGELGIPLTYAWSNGETSSEITIDTAGEYGVTTTSKYGCQAVASVQVIICEKPQKTSLGAASFGICPN